MAKKKKKISREEIKMDLLLIAILFSLVNLLIFWTINPIFTLIFAFLFGLIGWGNF